MSKDVRMQTRGSNSWAIADDSRAFRRLLAVGIAGFLIALSGVACTSSQRTDPGSFSQAAPPAAAGSAPSSRAEGSQATQPSVLPSNSSPGAGNGPSAEALGAEALRYVHVLSTELGPRDTESGGERRAAAFLAQEFQAAGLRIQQQGFSVAVMVRSEPRLSVTAPAPRDVSAEPMIGSDEGVGQGPLAFGGLGKAADLPAGGLKGKVALFERGEVRFQEKAENAVRAGAVAVVVSNNAAGPLFGSLLSGVGIPVVGISRDDGQSLKELLAQGEVMVRVAIKRVQLPSANVVAELPADTKGGIVIIGGHYDTIPGVPGANDNGSGTAVLLTLAKEIAGKRYPFAVRLVSFGAEELGLWGSRRYVESLPAEERSRIKAVMNLDVVGAQVLLGVLGDATLTQDLKAQATSMGLSLGAVSGDVSSDHLSFNREGIPAVILTTPDFSVIHTPEDTVDRVDPLRLGQAAALVLRYLEALGQR